LVRVHTLIFLGIFVTRVTLPAYVMLGYWFLLQILGGLPGMAESSPGGVAFWAHIGGFLAGALLIPFFKDPALVRRPRRSADWSWARPGARRRGGGAPGAAARRGLWPGRRAPTPPGSTRRPRRRRSRRPPPSRPACG